MPTQLTRAANAGRYSRYVKFAWTASSEDTVDNETTYLSFAGGSDGSENSTVVNIPFAAVFSRLYVHIEPTGATDTTVVSLRDDAATTGLTCTVAAAGTDANDLVNRVLVAAGSEVCLIVVAADATARQVTASVQVEPRDTL